MNNSFSTLSRFAALGEFIALDFETTGLDPNMETVIDIGAVRYKNGQEIERFSTLVNPGRQISPEISQLTGITNEALADAPYLKAIDQKLYDFLGTSPIMAHNASFERAFLHHIFGEDFNPPMMDSCHILALCYPLAPTLSLEAFIKRFGLRDYEHHRGLEDALDMVAVIKKIDQELQRPEFADLCAIVEYWFSKSDTWLWKPFFTHRHENPYHGELPLFRNFKEQYAGKERQTIDSSLAHAPAKLKDPSFFMSAYEQYQVREAQQKLAAKAAQTLNDGGVYVAEAGTGTGKTLAYLTASLAALAVDSETPIIISTHTKALQNQFLEQELPRLKQLFALPDLHAVVLKGMSNYACLRKINEAMPIFESFMYADNPDEAFAGAFLTQWILQTREGEIDELPRPLFGDFPIVQRVSSEARADFRDCTRHECSFFEQCFYFKKQWESSSAHILAVNHSLLLTYPKSYPEFNRLVVDEADEIISEAIEAFSYVASLSQMTDVYNRLRGSDGLMEASMSEVRLIARNIASNAPKTLSLPEPTSIAALLERFAQTLGRLNMVLANSRADELFTIQATLREDRFSLSQKQVITGECENLRVIATELANLAEQILKSAAKAGAVPNEVPTVRELQHRMDDLAGIAHTLAMFLEQKEDEAASYIRIEKHDWSIVVTPFNIGERFASEILQERYAAVFTSATISNTKDMSDFMRGIGSHTLTEHRVSTSRFLSPFNYRENSRIIFLKNFVANNHPEFPRLSADFIANAAEYLGGKTLVLFTSKDRMRKVHDALFPLLRSRGIELMSHGITHTSQHKAIEHFKTSDAAVLMGARGLWKGVDIPGDDLQCLVLEKMPYAVPNPFTRGLQDNLVRKYEQEARERGDRNPDLKKLAGFAWNEVDKPLMFQAFRQMFGRLIRTETDKGIMFVLDSQLFNNNLSARHKQLMELLPDVPYGVCSPDAALREIDSVIFDV